MRVAVQRLKAGPAAEGDAAAAVAGTNVRHSLVHDVVDGQGVVVQIVTLVIVQEVVVVNLIDTFLEFYFRLLYGGTLLTHLAAGEIAGGKEHQQC